jgi:hypothetical protein
MTELEKRMWEDDIKFITKLREEKEELQRRINETIEYIEENKDKVIAPYGDNEDTDYETCLDEDEIKKLLEILKGDSNG